MAVAEIAALAHVTDAACADLRRRFAKGGFTPQLVAAAEAFVPGILLAPRLPVLRWWLQRRPEPGAALARLFLYQDSLSHLEAAAALGGDLLAALTSAGVVAPAAGGRVVSPFLFTPVEDELWFLSDPLSAGPEAVMGPGGGTTYVGRLVPRPFAGTALDLGCGAGTLALIAARAGARRAVGVDINPRAVELARFNARVNELTAEFAVADASRPLPDAAGGGRHQSFDLVLSQPPFVVQPPDQPSLTYLYGGTTGDELPQQFLASMAAMLAPGGRALALLQSAERAGEPLAGRLRTALAHVPHSPSLAVLVLGAKAPPPATQASVFASFEDPTLGQRYAAVACRYLDHFAALGMREFTGALVVLSAPPLPPEPRSAGIDAPEAARLGGLGAATAASAGYTLGLRLANPGYDAASLELYLGGLELLTLPREHFEAARLRLSPHARFEPQMGPTPLKSLVPEADGEREHTASAPVLRISPPGIGTDWTIELESLRLLTEIDAADTLGAALSARLADRGAAAGRAPATAARDRITDAQQILGLARDALVRGALVRVPSH